MLHTIDKPYSSSLSTHPLNPSPTISTHHPLNRPPPLSLRFQEKAASSSTSVVRHKSRSWTHMNFCAFCAKSKFTDQNALTKCAHCPRVFHADCLENHGLTRGTGMFICPHHKCAACSRSTASAGEPYSLLPTPTRYYLLLTTYSLLITHTFATDAWLCHCLLIITHRP